MCCPPPLASQYWIINILCTSGRYPWPWPKPLVPTRPIPPPASGNPRSHPFSLPPHPISLFSSPPPVSLHSLQPSPLRFPTPSPRGARSRSRCKRHLRGRRCGLAVRRRAERDGRRGGAAGGLRARARAAALLGTAWHGRLFPGSVWAAGLGRPWSGAQQHHVPALSQPLEPGVLCLHGGSGHPGGVGCLL